MFRVNTSDGKTLTLDLVEDDARSRWNALSKDTITGVSVIVRDGKDLAIFTCPKPQRPVVSWDIERHEGTSGYLFERVTCFIDTYSVALTVYPRSRPVMSRVDVGRPGRRFAPTR